jgi:hypothetical protein
MQQRWWLFGVGAVGIVLAILLFPRPDTGDDMPAPDPSNIDPTNFRTEKPLSGAIRPGATPRPKLPEDRMRTGPKPGMEEIRELRSTPAAVYSAKFQGPFSGIRYALRKEGSDEARALSDEIAPIIEALRDNRRDPSSNPMDALLPQLAATIEKVSSSPFGELPDVIAAVQQYEKVLAEYEEAIAAAGTTEDPKEEP